MQFGAEGAAIDSPARRTMGGRHALHARPTEALCTAESLARAARPVSQGRSRARAGLLRPAPAATSGRVCKLRSRNDRRRIVTLTYRRARP